MMAAKSFVFRFGDVEVRERELSVTKAAQTVAVEPKAFRVLLILLRNPGRLVTKDELLNAVWPNVTVGENSLARAVALLRKTLDDDTREPRYIATIPTAGYRFIHPVEAFQDACEEPTGVVPVQADPHPRHISGRKLLTFTLMAGAAGTLATWIWWFWSRPLAPPRITEYTQVTHDGRDKWLAGIDGNRLYFTQMSPRSVNQIGVNDVDQTARRIFRSALRLCSAGSAIKLCRFSIILEGKNIAIRTSLVFSIDSRGRSCLRIYAVS
jgi:DNA-binding winged helix-turn-helix (wHTH) protein